MSPLRSKRQEMLFSLPQALSEFEALVQTLGTNRPGVFLDYDGTLTDIAERPDQASLPAPTRQVVQDLATQTLTCIISGRDLDDVRDLVQIDRVLYAGSHGFDLLLPDQERVQPFPPDPALDQVEQKARDEVQPIAGVILERKRFALAIHYRQVAAEQVQEVQEAVQRIVTQFPSLRQNGGKKVIEIQPDQEWDKGRALSYILDRLGPKAANLTPVYIGDDLTDENAFTAIQDRGIGICVGDTDRRTHAAYRLQDPDQVRLFLQRISDWLSSRESSSP